MAKKLVRKVVKKKHRKVKLGRGRIGNKVGLAIVAIMVALPIAIFAANQQTTFFNYAALEDDPGPAIDLNSSADITTTKNPDGTMGPATSSDNASTALPYTEKADVVFTLSPLEGDEVYPSGVYPSLSYVTPTTEYIPPTSTPMPTPTTKYTAPTAVYYPPTPTPTYKAPSPTPIPECGTYAVKTNQQTYDNKGKGKGNGNGNGKGKGNSKKGGPQEVVALCLTISKVEVHAAYLGALGNSTQPKDKWETLDVKNQTIDIYNQNAPKDLGLTKLGVGRYTQVRLYVTKAVATLNNGQKVTLIIQGKNNIVKVVKSFEIIAGKQTKITLSFDAGHSVIKGGNKYLLKPVVAKMEAN